MISFSSLGVAALAARPSRPRPSASCRDMPLMQVARAAAPCESLHVAGVRLHLGAILFRSIGPPVSAAIACGRERFVFLLPELQEVGVEDDVGVENLARSSGSRATGPSRSRRWR